MEIERKYLFKEGEFDYTAYPYLEISQAYLCRTPVVRIRKKGDGYFLTCKGSGTMARDEYETAITEDIFNYLSRKVTGNIIEKKRYLIPVKGGHTAELDIFEGKLKGLKIIEVEFTDLEDAEDFIPPKWFGKDVTADKKYQNSNLSIAEHI